MENVSADLFFKSFRCEYLLLFVDETLANIGKLFETNLYFIHCFFSVNILQAKLAKTEEVPNPEPKEGRSSRGLLLFDTCGHAVEIEPRIKMLLWVKRIRGKHHNTL